jgi:hypothetical protein
VIENVKFSFPPTHHNLYFTFFLAVISFRGELEVKLCMCMLWRCVGGVDVELHSSLVLVLRWKLVLSPTYPSPSLRERTLGTHWLGDWVGHTGGLDVLGKKSLGGYPVILAWPACSLVTIPTELLLLLFIHLLNCLISPFLFKIIHIYKSAPPPNAIGHTISRVSPNFFQELLSFYRQN